MKDILRKYYYLFLGAIKGLTFRPVWFELKERQSVSKHTSDFLIVYLKHQAHLLEKCTKNEFDNEVRGKKRFLLVKDIVQELELRGCDEYELLSWAKRVCDIYIAWVNSKEIQVSVISNYEKDIKDIFDVSSVRFFTNEEPDIDLIIDCVKSAQKASASCNRQPFKIGILNNKQTFFGEANNKSLFEKSPYRIFIFSNRDNYSEKYAEAIDVGMFSQNFMLKANILGLASCCCYASEHLEKPQAYYRHLFDLSNEYYCYLSIIVGFPSERVEKPPRRKVENIVTIREG